MWLKGEVILDPRLRRAEEAREERELAQVRRDWARERRQREVRRRRAHAEQKRFARREARAERERQQLRHPFVACLVGGRYRERRRGLA